MNEIQIILLAYLIGVIFAFCILLGDIYSTWKNGDDLTLGYIINTISLSLFSLVLVSFYVAIKFQTCLSDKVIVKGKSKKIEPKEPIKPINTVETWGDYMVNHIYKVTGFYDKHGVNTKKKKEAYGMFAICVDSGRNNIYYPFDIQICNDLKLKIGSEFKGQITFTKV